MPKKRKTRKQKILLDTKRHMVSETPSVSSSQKKETPQKKQNTIMPGATFSLSTVATDKLSSPKKTSTNTSSVIISTQEYTYLGNDMIKTAIVTGAIVIAEIVIRFLFRG